MTRSLFLTGFASLLALTSALQYQVIHPFSDSACKNPIGVKAVNDGHDVTEIHLGSGTGAQWRGSKYQTYKRVDFENATAPDNGIGNWVWWNTGPIDRGCKVVIMTPFANDVNNWMWMAPDQMQAPGKVILTASQEGCVFTQLPVSATLWTTFCCGTHCDHWSGNAPNPRPSGGKHRREEITVQLQTNNALPVTTDLTPTRMGSLAAHASLHKRESCDVHDKACADKFWKGCQIVANRPALAAGFQVAVSQIQTASGGPGAGDSNIAASLAFTVGTSTSVSEGTSFSSTQGLEISVTAGVSFPVEAETTLSASLSLTEEVNRSTSHEQNESKQETVTQTLAQVPGTTGFLSYTPYYNCYMPTITCGKMTNTGNVNICYPAYDNKGKIMGEYSIVTIG